MRDGIAILVPAYNEAAHIAAVVRAARRWATTVVVDDGSTDQTVTLAEHAGAIVLRHGPNRGKGRALEQGFAYAREHGYEAVITMDADGQHDPKDIASFLAIHTQQPRAVLIGNRTHDLRAMPWVRRCTNRVMTGLLSRRMVCRVADTQCGYRLYPLRALEPAFDLVAGFAAESEILVRLAQRGVPLVDVPIRTIYSGQQSKISPWRDTWRFWRMWRQLAPR